MIKYVIFFCRTQYIIYNKTQIQNTLYYNFKKCIYDSKPLKKPILIVVEVTLKRPCSRLYVLFFYCFSRRNRPPQKCGPLLSRHPVIEKLMRSPPIIDLVVSVATNIEYSQGCLVNHRWLGGTNLLCS